MSARALSGVLAAVTLLAGCGDSGSPTEPPGHAKDNYFAYQSFPVGNYAGSSGLTLVQAEDPSQRIVLAADGVSNVTVLYVGDSGAGTVENLRGHTLMYVQDGYWMKVSLRQNGSQVPVRAASTPVTGVCLSALLARKPTSSRGAFLVYFERGADLTCYTDDDVARRIPLNGSPSSPALPGPVGSLRGSFDGPDGTLLGFLFLHDGALRRYDAAFGHPKLVLDGVTSFYGLTRLPEGNHYAINGSVRLITADGDVSAPFADTDPFPVGGAADDDYTYFTAGGVSSGPWPLYRLPRGGTGPSEMMWDGEDNGYALVFGETEDAIIVYAQNFDLGRARLYAVPRDAVGATSAPLLEDVDGGLSWRSYRETPLLYTVFDRATGANVATAKVLRYDGTIESAGPGTEWVGVQAAATQPLDTVYSLFRKQPRNTHGYLVEGVVDRDARRHQDAVLKARRLSDGADTTLTTVADNAFVYLSGAGAPAMGMLEMEAQYDVIEVDLDAGSFVRITETDDRAEFVSAH